MANGAPGETLRQLRDLIEHGAAVGLDDGQLLARYARSRDEVSFEALMARHGPMVLATCRAVLRHEHDVEDAFQATFLVLARKARTVRAGDALGGWLHRVAHRAAVQAGVETRRHRRREAEVAMTTRQSAPIENDIPCIVHEEIDRLPDRQRLPVVLCDLEGLTYEQAARHLRWTEPTLRHRLVAARRRLRERLIRRGLGAGAVGIVLAGSTSGARATVPAVLARSAVVAAVGGPSPATVAALTITLLGSMLMTRLKLTSAGLLAGIALASAGVFAVGALRADEPKAATRAPGIAGGKTAAVPVRSGGAAAEPGAPAGGGPGIEGRVVDLEGRPVAGARVEVADLWSAAGDDLERWLDRARDRGLAYPSEGLSPGNLPAGRAAGAPSLGPPPSPTNRTTTGPDGRFHLAGVGLSQLARIAVTGPTIATTYLYVMGRDGPEVRATVHQGLKPGQVVFHARRLACIASPGKPIQGVVRDKDTGRPLAGITLHAAVYEEHSLVPAPGIEARTDDRGHYSLVGLPRAPAYRLFVDPGAGVPYPKPTLRAAVETPGFEPVNFDVGLKRGVLVRGRVTDMATGLPVNAAVDVYAFAENPHVGEFPGFRSGDTPRSFTVDGRYEVVALPGRGLVGVQVGGYLVRYRTAVGAGAIRGYDPKLAGFRTHPGLCFPANYHAVAEIDLDPRADSATLNLQVDPGRTIAVTIVDPEGRPVAGTVALGVSDLHPSTGYPQTSPTIEIHALDPSRPRRVTVTHPDRDLIGSVYLRGDEGVPLTIRLQRWGTITGRIVDDDGRPRGGLGIVSAGGSSPERPAEQGILPGGDVGGGVRIGRDGRFRIEGLVPGLKYGGGAGEGMMYHGDLFHDVTVAPGEVKDLGDLRAIPARLAN